MEPVLLHPSPGVDNTLLGRLERLRDEFKDNKSGPWGLIDEAINKIVEYRKSAEFLCSTAQFHRDRMMYDMAVTSPNCEKDVN